MRAFVWGLALAVGPACTMRPAGEHRRVRRAHRRLLRLPNPGIETAPDGSLLAFAEARKYNLDDPGFGKQDIDLVCRRSPTAARLVADDADRGPRRAWSAANPATVVDRTNGRVWLLYLRCKPGRNTDTGPARAPTTRRCWPGRATTTAGPGPSRST